MYQSSPPTLSPAPDDIWSNPSSERDVSLSTTERRISTLSGGYVAASPVNVQSIAAYAKPESRRATVYKSRNRSRCIGRLIRSMRFGVVWKICRALCPTLNR